MYMNSLSPSYVHFYKYIYLLCILYIFVCFDHILASLFSSSSSIYTVTDSSCHTTLQYEIEQDINNPLQCIVLLSFTIPDIYWRHATDTGIPLTFSLSRKSVTLPINIPSMISYNNSNNNNDISNTVVHSGIITAYKQGAQYRVKTPKEYK